MAGERRTFSGCPAITACAVRIPRIGFCGRADQGPLRRYEFAGMWFDMGIWPYTVCYCRHCESRYAREIGGEIPTVVEWNNPVWRKIVEVRNRWLAEYTEVITRTAKTCKSGISVGHQSAGWTCGWQSGAGQEYFALSDYLGGDFYGSISDHSMSCKFLSNLTQNKPFEFMTSRCPDLSEHTTVKPVEQIRTEIFLTLAHNGARFRENLAPGPSRTGFAVLCSLKSGTRGRHEFKGLVLGQVGQGLPGHGMIGNGAVKVPPR